MNNIFKSNGLINSSDRENFIGQKGVSLWLTGYSGAGKTTIAYGLEKKLYDTGRLSYVFDGDNIRHGLCKDLGFTSKDRLENLRRTSEVIKLFCDVGIICISAFISPLKVDRKLVKNIIGREKYIEIYIKCSLEVCMARDIKGLYALARQGLIKNFTGISAPYEIPVDPSLIIDTESENAEKSINRIYSYLCNKNII